MSPYIGYRFSNNLEHFYGEIGDMGFYNKRLTEQEISNLVNNNNIL